MSEADVFLYSFQFVLMIWFFVTPFFILLNIAKMGEPKKLKEPKKSKLKVLFWLFYFWFKGFLDKHFPEEKGKK